MNPLILNNGHNNSEQVHFSLQNTFLPKEFSVILCRTFRLCKNDYVGSNRNEGGRKIWIPVIYILLTFIAFQAAIKCSTFNINRKEQNHLGSDIDRIFCSHEMWICKIYNKKKNKKNKHFDSHIARGKFCSYLMLKIHEWILYLWFRASSIYFIK
jgi:hypothetical protein